MLDIRENSSEFGSRNDLSPVAEFDEKSDRMELIMIIILHTSSSAYQLHSSRSQRQLHIPTLYIAQTEKFLKK